MTYAEHLANGRVLAPADREALLRSLGADERFAAVVSWLEANRESFSDAGCRQDLAADHGRVAHAQGSVHAVRTLIAQLANLLSPPPESGIPAPPPGQDDR